MNAIHKMMLSAAATGALLGVASTGWAVPDRAEVIQRAASVVKVQAFDHRNQTFFGTGVVVAPHRVATSCHVTRHSAQIVVIYRGESFQVMGQAADIDHDTCVLDVPALNTPALALTRSHTLRVGQAVWAMGFEGGAGLQFRTGIVRALHKHDGAWVIESTTAFTSGSSGGALMDDSGHLIGLLTYRLRGDRRSYFSVPTEWLSNASTTRESLPQVQPVTQGLAFWQRGPEELPYFMRAHRLVIDSDWRTLLVLSDAWLLSDANNTEAWWYRGASLEMLTEARGAASAYRQALALDPGFIPALFSLGRLVAQLGDSDEALRIITMLSAIDIELGTCLSHRITPTAESPPTETSNEACSAM